MKKDATNSFSMGTAQHRTEQVVFDVFDEGNATADFQEIAELVEDFVKNQENLSRLPEQLPSAAGSVIITTGHGSLSIRDKVLEELDRFPKNG